MTDRSSLAAQVDAMRGARVLCIGDLMLDRFIYGDVERISPEAPIPVVRIRREISMLGGAGNVVRNLVALGAKPAFVSVVGDDDAGREVGGLIGALDGVDPCLVVEPGRQTTIKLRYIAGSQQLLRADRETASAIAEITCRRVVDMIERLLPRVDLVVLSDYGKGVLCSGVLQATIQAARAAGRPVVVDPKGSDYQIYAGASLLTPNRKELAEASKMPVGSDEEIVAAARHLLEACAVDAVLATRSQDGMTLVTSDGEPRHLPAEAREVFDVSGAGDTVVATLAAALAGGVPLPQAAQLANVAAGIVVAKVGTAVAYAKEVAAAIHTQELLLDDTKVMGWDRLLDQAERWRHRGWRIGFTNGCFDLLHPGHVSLLRQAKAACDRLVVGLNSDASVQRLKGPTRPVQNETARATVLASLEAVDAVVLFDQDTPLELITALRPDVLVKGADYTIDKVVGADVVQAHGGKVLLADLEAGHSTTATIARMK
jgi:D-beta-D-heptose 7-phosphate kinase/D-beta-D-heptose 1-phosphate adenosyltransferase